MSNGAAFKENERPNPTGAVKELVSCDKIGGNGELTNHTSSDEHMDVRGDHLQRHSTQHDHSANNDGRPPTQPIRN